VSVDEEELSHFEGDPQLKKKLNSRKAATKRPQSLVVVLAAVWSYL